MTMDQKQRFFMYDRKDVLLLLALGLLIALFAFTLGVHLGKKVDPSGKVATIEDVSPVRTNEDQVPNKTEFNEQLKEAGQAADLTLNQALHEEVGKVGVKLDVKRQVELPEKMKTSRQASSEMTSKEAEKKQNTTDEDSVPSLHRETPHGRYTLQIGSFPSLRQAQDRVTVFESRAITPFMRKAKVQDKGLWYRIYFGGYQTKDEAVQAGKDLAKKGVIEGYVVVNATTLEQLY